MRLSAGITINVPTIISIHAPAKGATLCFAITLYPRSIYFNPRTRKGCDAYEKYPLVLALHISIHAPAKGATKNVVKLNRLQLISIHAPAKGATNQKIFTRPYKKFQSTHPQRVRQSNVEWVTRCTDISIHAPAKGATAIYRNIYRKPYYIYVILSLFLQ